MKVKNVMAVLLCVTALQVYGKQKVSIVNNTDATITVSPWWEGATGTSKELKPRQSASYETAGVLHRLKTVTWEHTGYGVCYKATVDALTGTGLNRFKEVKFQVLSGGIYTMMIGDNEVAKKAPADMVQCP